MDTPTLPAIWEKHAVTMSQQKIPPHVQSVGHALFFAGATAALNILAKGMTSDETSEEDFMRTVHQMHADIKQAQMESLLSAIDKLGDLAIGLRKGKDNG